MPVRTVEQLKQREVALAQKAAKLAAVQDPKAGADVRRVKKKLRRTQRRRRSLVAQAARKAPKAQETPS